MTIRRLFCFLLCLGTLAACPTGVAAGEDAAKVTPTFGRHVEAVFSRLGCNGGTCHGAVQGKNGFRLSLFGAKPAEDFLQVVRGGAGRRLDLLAPENSLLLQKPSGRVAHGGGRVLPPDSHEYQVLLRWIAARAPADGDDEPPITTLAVSRVAQTLPVDSIHPLTVVAHFADGSQENVTSFASFESLDAHVATVDRDGHVRTLGIGDTSIIVRYREAAALASITVPRHGDAAFPAVAPHNFVDEHILAKLRRLNVAPAGLCDDATFLRRVRLDVTGSLPTPEEVREFLADGDPQKRARKIAQVLDEPGFAALWAMKFCDILGVGEFGVYADGLSERTDAPRFHHWIRERLRENISYDEFAARILTATSREGRSVDDWAAEVNALGDGFTSERSDLQTYAQRKTPDLYWARGSASGVPGTLQIAHAFLGLRLECAQCHRHPHDVWQQDDLLSFANFFMRVRKPGFQGDNERKFPETAAVMKQWEAEAKRLAEEVKKLRETKGKELEAAVKNAKTDEERGAARKANERFRQEVADMDRRSKHLGESGKRLLHAEITHLPDGKPASVTSPLGTQESGVFRLLGEREAIAVDSAVDPRQHVAEWLRRPDNPFFTKAIVNRVWAHYFGRGIVDPPDNLSSFNPPSHPQLLDELCRQFIEQRYNLKWLHATILASRTYQQSSVGEVGQASSLSNQGQVENPSYDTGRVENPSYGDFAAFAYRRLPAEVLLDALNQATGTSENMDMRYDNWPDEMKAVEIPYLPRNEFVKFMLAQFGRPERNSAAQCDCERDGNPSVLQVLSFANHPRVWEKIADPKGRVASLLRDVQDEDRRLEELFLATLGRPPDVQELASCRDYVAASASPEEGLRGVLWSLLNTREFVLQH